MEQSRRRFLEAGGVLVGTGILGTSAGCIGILGGGGGGGGTFGDNADWFYEPGTIQDSDHYSVSFRATPDVVDNEDEFDSETYDSLKDNFESSYEFLGLDFEDVESQTGFGGYLATLLSGYQVDRSAVVGSLADNDYQKDGEYGGVEVFLGPNESQAIGLTDDEILVTSGSWNTDNEAIDVLEAAVDTYNGDEDRYVDENDDFAEVTSQLDSGTFTYAATQEEVEETDAENGQFEGAVALGSAQTVDGETMDNQAVVVFSDEEYIDTDEIEDWTDDEDTFGDVDDIAIDTSGRSVVITGTTDTAEY